MAQRLVNYQFCSPGESPEPDQCAKIVYDYIPSENSSLTIGTEARPNDKDRFRDRKLNNWIKVFYLQNVMEIFDFWCRTIQNKAPAEMQGLCCFWRLELPESFHIAATRPATPYLNQQTELNPPRLEPLQLHISPTLTGSCTYL